MTTSSLAEKPRVRFSLRWKITLPFMLLALMLGLGATYLVTRFLAASTQERFLRQLSDSGQQALDGVVRSEGQLLELERLVANTDGVFEAVQAQDAEDLRNRILPLVINSGADLVVVLNPDGVSLVTIRQTPGAQKGQYETLRGEAYYADWESVRALLDPSGEGAKRAGLETLALGANGRTDVFLTGGPITTSGGKVLGAVLVGRYVNDLADDLRAQTGATISIYDPLGTLLASSNESASAANQALPDQTIIDLTSGEEDQSPVRSLLLGGTPYGEVLTRLAARGGQDFLGFLGISLPEATVVSSGGPDPRVVVVLSALALLLVVIIGLLISNSITRPLVRMADASTAVATGNLDTRVPVEGSDEISVLAGTFNRMVEGLREGLVYHDLLGRAVTPEVREELRRSLSEGARAASVQAVRATVLVAGLRGVGADRAARDPAKTMASLSEYFAALVPLIAHHGGVVYRFDGEVSVALFGLLPKPSPAPVGAVQATHAAFELLELVERLNARREEAGLPHLSLGVAVATGGIVAGGLGTRDRIQYTVIGEAVDTALEMERVLRETSADGLLVSGGTYKSLGGARSHFDFGRHGQAQVRGWPVPLEIYEVTGRRRRLLEAGGADFFDDTTAPLDPVPTPRSTPAPEALE
ncbi:MAG TPA: cache domain-containing protein [Anaerolineales bacterium]|nr:cache domain-containing protein [Anaerolineales bacterium]